MLRLSLALVLASILTIVADNSFADPQAGFGTSSGGGLAAEEQSFKTELFSGAAASSVPFLLPPGANGYQPELGLRYHSQSGNGWIGHGWQLAPPAIERMTKFGAPSYSDDPESGDYFALSDDRLVRDDAGFYHAMRENFARVERVDSGGVISHWIVHRTNGERQWFGSTADSKIQNGAGQTFRWLLSRSEDPNGNYMEYRYWTAAETGDDGTAYLEQVAYSFAGDTSLGSATIRTVDFTLGPRPDPTIVYSAGIRMAMSRRLKSVAVRHGGNLVTRYDLVYSDEDGLAPASDASLLRRVVRVGADGSSTLPYDVFSYSKTGLPTWTLDTGIATQLAALTIGQGAAEENFRLTTDNWVVADANGDGAPDILATKPNPDLSLDRAVYLNDRSATAFRSDRIPQPSVPGIPAILDLQAAVSNEATRLVDYDGDGFLDILFSLSVPSGWFDAVYENVTNAWLPEIRPGYALPPVPMADFCSSGGGVGPNVGWTVPVDVNGDGLPDLVHDSIPGSGCFGARSIREVYLNTGSGWTLDAGWSAALETVLTTLNTQVAHLLFFDLNGDGLVDIGRDGANQDGVLDSTLVFVNDQTGWRRASDEGFTIPANFRPIDLNGDGLADHAGASSQLNRGTAIGGASFALPSPFHVVNDDRMAVDIDGNGLVDFVRASATTKVVYRADGPGPGHVLTRIERATGATVDLAYRPTTAGSCYDDSGSGFDFDRSGCHADPLLVPAPDGTLTSCTYPLVGWGSIQGSNYCAMPFELLPFPVQTVESVSVDDRVGNVRTDRVRFTHGLFDPAEREFRGFGRVIERPQSVSYTNPKTSGTVSLAALRITQFYQYAFLRGEAASVELVSSLDDQLDAGDSLIERIVNLYAFTRGDTTGTFLLVGDAILASGNALVCDPATAGLDPSCSLYDLEQDPYATMVDLPASLPYQAFHDSFCNAAPGNRDCSHAYLVLQVGSQTGRWDASVPYVVGNLRWHDTHGNAQANWDRGNFADSSDDRVEVREFAVPSGASPPNFVNAPSRIYQQTPGGIIQSESQIHYDNLAHGQVEKGRPTGTVQVLKDPVHGLDTTVTTVSGYVDLNAGLPSLVTDPFQTGAAPRFSLFSYDAGKSFVATEARGGLTTTTTHDPPGAPRGLGLARFVDDPNGGRVTRGADTFGRPTFVAGPDPRGTTELRVYFDSQGWTPSVQRLRVSTYDGRGNETQVRHYTDGLGRTIQTQTTGLSEVDTPATIYQETQYDVLGRVAFQGRSSYSLGAGGTSTYYDLRGRPRFVVQPDDGVQEIVYDGLLTIQYDATGGRKDVLRDGAGSVIRITQYPDVGSGVAEHTHYVYDPLGRLQLVCSPLATQCGLAAGGGMPVALEPRYTTVINYDWLSRRVRLVDPDLGESRYRYDGAGNLTLQTTPQGEMQYAYDELGRLKLGSDLTNGGQPYSASFELIYGDQLPVSERPPNSLGRLVTSSDSGERRYEYDLAGRVTRLETKFLVAEEPDPSTYTFVYEYDDLDRVVSTAYPDGEVITQTYDRIGLDRIESSERVYVSKVTHNAERRPRVMTYGNGDEREFTYQPNTGYLSTLTGRPTSGGDFLSRTFGYDMGARVTAIADAVDPAESLSAILYDRIGRLDRVTRNGQELAYDYDALGNLIQKEWVVQRYEHPSKPHVLYEAATPSRFQYDDAGNQIVRDGLQMSYDTLSRLHSATSAGQSTLYRYDYEGERTARVRGADVSFYAGPDYEIKNHVRVVKTIRVEGHVVAQVSSMLASQSAVVPGLRSRPADPGPLLFALVALTLAAAAAGLAAPRRRAPAWERALASGLALAVLLTPVVPALAATKGDVRIDQQFDLGDVVVLMRSLSGELALTSEQLEAADVAPMVAGQAAGDGHVDVGDLRLLMEAARGADVDGDGLTVAQENALGLSPLLRDTDGNGIPDNAEDTDGDGLPNSVEIALGYDPANPDTDGDGYVDGDDPEPLSAAGTLVAYVHADHLGSSAVLTDGSGTVIRRITYGVFGNVRANLRAGPPTTLDPAHKYTGQQLDDDTGLLYYGARWYDATYGVFTSGDPIVPDPLDPQTLNRYSYVRGDPLRATDPTGNTSIGTYDGWGSGWGGGSSWSWGGSGFSSGFGGSSFFGGTSLFDSSWSFQISSWNSSNWSSFDSSSSRGSSGWSKMFESAYYPDYERDREGRSQSGGEQVASAADTAFRWFVFDYEEPLGGSYWLEAATLIPIGKVAKGFKVGRAVIGKLDDLAKLLPGEHTLLKHLPDRGSPRANWAQNSSVLRREIRKGNPIRDASIDPKTGALLNDTGFLRAERQLLRNQGWTYNPATQLWSPGP